MASPAGLAREARKASRACMATRRCVHPPSSSCRGCAPALRLESWQLPRRTAAALRRLANLRSLRLRARSMPPELLPSVLELRQLTCLWLESTMALPDLRVSDCLFA